MNKVYTKETILKLLSGMSSEKEIRKYLERFSSDDFRFAVIKVGGAVIQNDLENLVSSISFLHEVGLKPIIVHGGGPSLSSELKAKEIEFSFLDGQRITTSEVLDIAHSVFTSESKKITNALEKKNVTSKAFYDDAFVCEIKDNKLGFVGEVCEINIASIKKSIDDGEIPILSPIGRTIEGQLVNINADNATLAISEKILPDKVIFLSELGGILDQNNVLISNINLKDDYEYLMSKDWLYSGMKHKLKQINNLLNLLPKNSSVSITKPLNLTRELFTDAGSGTLVKLGHKINKFESVSLDQSSKIQSILEKSFKGRLNKNFFDGNKKYYLSSCDRAVIVMRYEEKAAYMDKFAVMSDARGEGLGKAIMKKMMLDHPKIFWRSRPNNNINSYYKNACDGFQKHSEWNIYWIGIEDLDELSGCIRYAIEQPLSITYEY